MRADARRSLEAILAAAGELFAERGSAVQMEEIAARAGLGMGTLYRHFPTKQALLTANIGRRFMAMIDLARTAEAIPDPGEAFRVLVVSYLEAAERDAAFRYAILGPEPTRWEQIAEAKEAFAAIAGRILERAVAAGRLRSDLRFGDFVLITRGAMANMNPEDDDWRRHLALMLDGIRSDDDDVERWKKPAL
jgi:AcrR family transcriptional regulator